MNRPTPADARRAVNDAIQNLMASRLGRGFVPLGLLFVWGAGAVPFGGAMWLPAGALAAAASMLAYGLGVVQRAMGQGRRPWMRLASLGSVLPSIFGLYVTCWIGLRGFTLGMDFPAVASASAGTVLGLWSLAAWLKVIEIEQLARIMTANLDAHGGVD